MRTPLSAGSMLLLWAAALSASIALIHIGIALSGAPAYAYFGAGKEMVRLAARGSWQPAALTLGIAVIFAGFSGYALAGAGFGPQLPMRRAVLFTISGLFLARGALLIPQLWQAAERPSEQAARAVLFSFIALATGVVFLSGTLLAGRMPR